MGDESSLDLYLPTERTMRNLSILCLCKRLIRYPTQPTNPVCSSAATAHQVYTTHATIEVYLFLAKMSSERQGFLTQSRVEKINNRPFFLADSRCVHEAMGFFIRYIVAVLLFSKSAFGLRQVLSSQKFEQPQKKGWCSSAVARVIRMDHKTLTPMPTPWLDACSIYLRRRWRRHQLLSGLYPRAFWMDSCPPLVGALVSFLLGYRARLKKRLLVVDIRGGFFKRGW